MTVTRYILVLVLQLVLPIGLIAGMVIIVVITVLIAGMIMMLQHTKMLLVPYITGMQ